MELDSVTFQNNSLFYEELELTYRKHGCGYFILAPSGSGKTYYCQNQIQLDWLDGDDLWRKSGATPKGSWWTESLSIINRIEKRCDIITEEAKENGFWVMGSSSYWLKPDAVVIPNWDTHLRFIAHRQDNHYDGGATMDTLDRVISHRRIIADWHFKGGVPLFLNIEEAVTELSTRRTH